MDPVKDETLTDDKTQASESTTESASNVTIEDVNIDDFLPMPGAESIVTSDSQEEEEEEKPTVFSREKPANLDFLDEDSDEDDDDNAVDKAIAQLDEEIEDLENETSSSGKKKKAEGMVNTFSKLIEEGVLLGFENDDKPMSDYTEEDWKELLQANFEERERAIREQTPKEFFEALPDELKYAAEYVAKGGTDMKGLFRVLSQVEEQRTLDPGTKSDQETIVRQYLNATNFGNGDTSLIEDQVQEWMETGMMAKKAKQFKPKLDQMQEQVLASKLAQQERFRQEQQAKKEAYMDNIYHTLKPGELNGVKLTDDRQKFLWDELTTVKYESMTGRPTNLLGRLLEEYQFGEQPRYDLIAEALWLLSDPDDYKNNIGRGFSNETTQQTVRQLKTEESRKIASTSQAEPEEKTKRTVRKQPRNIFGRR